MCKIENRPFFKENKTPPPKKKMLNFNMQSFKIPR